MSKLIEALEVIRDECKNHERCDSCQLMYRNAFGVLGCNLDYWHIMEGKRPCDWPIDEVMEVEHEK
jgi:hypothetical protein